MVIKEEKGTYNWGIMKSFHEQIRCTTALKERTEPLQWQKRAFQVTRNIKAKNMSRRHKTVSGVQNTEGSDEKQIPE